MFVFFGVAVFTFRALGVESPRGRAILTHTLPSCLSFSKLALGAALAPRPQVIPWRLVARQVSGCSWQLLPAPWTFLASRSWLPDPWLPGPGEHNPGFKILATKSWLPDLACPIPGDPDFQILASRSWLQDPVFQILATRSWLSDPGYYILSAWSWLPSTRYWLPDPGYQNLATRSQQRC